jgi:hypothetical protein
VVAMVIVAVTTVMVRRRRKMTRCWLGMSYGH